MSRSSEVRAVDGTGNAALKKKRLTIRPGNENVIGFSVSIGPHLPPRHRGLDKGGNSDDVVTIVAPSAAVAASRFSLLQKLLSLWPSNALLFTLVKSFKLTRCSRTN